MENAIWMCKPNAYQKQGKDRKYETKAMMGKDRIYKTYANLGEGKDKNFKTNTK